MGQNGTTKRSYTILVLKVYPEIDRLALERHQVQANPEAAPRANRIDGRTSARSPSQSLRMAWRGDVQDPEVHAKAFAVDRPGSRPQVRPPVAARANPADDVLLRPRHVRRQCRHGLGQDAGGEGGRANQAHDRVAGRAGLEAVHVAADRARQAGGFGVATGPPAPRPWPRRDGSARPCATRPAPCVEPGLQDRRGSSVIGFAPSVGVHGIGRPYGDGCLRSCHHSKAKAQDTIAAPATGHQLNRPLCQFWANAMLLGGLAISRRHAALGYDWLAYG
jgi:hypothetical protein